MNAEEILKKVRMKIACGKFEQASKLLMGTENNNAESEALRAKIIGHTEGFEMAHNMFLDLEAVWPDKYNVYKMHCQLMQEQGDYNRAIEIAEKTKKKFPTEVGAFMLLIDSLELAGKYSAAFKTVNKALVNFPENPELEEKHFSLNERVNRIELCEEEIEEVKTEINLPEVVPHNELINFFIKFFSGRENVHAVQTRMGKNWGYLPVKESMDKTHLKEHFNGEKTLGTYLTRMDNTSKLMVFDLDVKKAWLENYADSALERKRINALLKQSTQKLVDICSMLDIEPLIELSGNKGLHFWFFSQEPIACRYWRTLGKWLLAKLNAVPEELSWEIFPKQDRVATDGLGNLVKLPLGIHQKSGRRSYFIDKSSFRPYQNQFQVLREWKKLKLKDFEKILGAITVDNCRENACNLNISQKSLKEKVIQAGDEQKNYQAAEGKPFSLSVKIPLPDRHCFEIEKLLSGCRPMWHILQQAKHERYLEPAQIHAFVYIFTHLGEEGKVFIHQVMNQLEEYSADAVNAKIRAVPPNPPGCNCIRKKIPEFCNDNSCNCQFRLPEGSYASPLIHAGIFPSCNNSSLQTKRLRQPAGLSDRELIGGESGAIDKLMLEYTQVQQDISKLKERGRLLRRQINKIFEEAGSDELKTRIRVYHKLPDNDSQPQES